MLPQAPQRDLSDERDRLRLLLDVNNAVVSKGTPPGIAIATRQTVLRDRLDFNEFFSPIIREAYNAGLRCGCSVPLICHDQVLGTINVGSLTEARFTRKDASTDYADYAENLCNLWIVHNS